MAELRDLRVVPTATAPASPVREADDSRQRMITEAQRAIQQIAEEVTRLSHSSAQSGELGRTLKETTVTLAQAVPVYTDAVKALHQREQQLENAIARLRESLARFQTQQAESAAQTSATAGRMRSWLLFAILLAAFSVAGAAATAFLLFTHAR